MKRLCASLERALRLLLQALMVVLVLVVLIQVGTRLLSKYVSSVIPPTPWTEELASFLLIWVALLGAVYAHRKRLHVADDFFVKKMSPRARRAAEGGVFAVELLFFTGVVGFGGARLVWVTLQLGQASSVLHWPVGMVYVVIPVSGFLMALFTLESRLGRRGETRL